VNRVINETIIVSIKGKPNIVVVLFLSEILERKQLESLIQLVFG